MVEKDSMADIQVYQRQTSAAIDAADALKVKKFEDVMDAADFLYKVKGIGEHIETEKESITKPANETLKGARTFFKKVEEQYVTAESLVKEKILTWYESEWKKGKAPDNTISGNQGKVTVVERVGVKITDATLIPKEYMLPDTKKIEHALKAGIKIEGAELAFNYSIMAAKL